MSKTIDERVVEMRFDNKQFESGVSTSLSTLEKLKKSLDMKGAVNGFDSLEKAANNVNMTGLGAAVESVQAKFSAMEVVAITALANITNSAINTGKQLIASLSVDQISEGWEKFTNKTQSVGTLIAQGYDLETVNEQLARLNWYTDETSYNFTDMVENISKFTASGKGLEESVTAMEGIANWAALSGQNANTASRAMYQLSQAMSAGVMRLEDYKSIQNASMDTAEFRQKCLDAAVALGTLKENADGTYETLNGRSFNLSQFTTQLTEGAWLTSDVMMRVFNDYSAAVDQIYEYAEEKGITASQAIEELGISVDEFGLKAFRAAQEARSWADVVDSVKDAVSTGWMNTFEIIFGNYEEATALWTDLANAMYDVFAAGAEDRNAMLEEWAELGGRTVLVEAFWEAWENVGEILGTVKEAFREVFPSMTAEWLYSLTEGLKTLAEHLKLSDSASANLKSTFKGLFAILDIVKQAFSAVLTALKPLFGGLDDLGGGILSVTGSIGDAIVAFDEFIKTGGTFQKVGEGIAKVFAKILSAFRTLKDKLKDKINISGIEGLRDILENIHEQMMKFGKDASKYFSGGIEQIKKFIARLKEMDSITLDDLGTILKDFKDNVVGYFLNISDSLDNVRKALDQFKENVKTRFEEAGESIDTFKGKLANFVLEARSKISSNLGMGELLTVGLGAGLIVTIKKIGDALEKLAKPFGDIAAVVSNFNGVLNSISKAINAKALETKSKALLNIAIAVGVLAGSLALLTLLDQNKLWSAVGALGALAAGLLAVSTAMGVISKVGGGSGIKSSLSIISIAGSLLILVGALKTMESLDGDKVWANVAVLGAMVSGLALVAGLLGKFAPKLSKGSLGLIAIAAALKIMVSALKDLDQMKFEHLDQSVGMLLGIMASLTAVSLACKSIKMSSAIGVLALVASLKIFISAFEDFAALDIDNMKNNIQSFAAILTMFAGLMVASKFAGANAAKAGVGILAMSASLILVMISFKMIASMDKSTLSQVTGTVSQILLVFGAVVALSNFAGANAAKAGAMLLMMSGALVILSGAIVILSHIDPDGLTRAVAAISVLEIMFAGLIAVTSLAKECKSTLILLSVTIGILAVALGTLSMINSDNLKAASLSLSAIIATFAMLVASTSLAKSATGTLVVITAVVAALGGVIYLLAGLPADSVLPVAEALSLLLTSLSLSLLLIGKMGTIAPTAFIAIGVMTLIVAGLAAIIGVLASMNLDSTLEIAVGLSTLLLSLSAACAVLTLVGAGGPAAFIGIGALATLIVGIGSIMAGIGALVTYFPDMELFVTKGISLLEQIGYGIGSFFGNIASGLLESMSSSLPVMGENLSLFMTNMQPFLDGAASINASALDGVKALAETILILTKANILDGLASWFTGGTSMAEFGQELADFAPYFASYYESIKGIKGSVVESSANAAKALAEFASEIPNSGGVVGWFAGENNLSMFAQELTEFGPLLKIYADSITGLDAGVVVNSANAAKALAEMANNLPNQGGAVSWFTGDNTLSAFGTELSKFGPLLKIYADSITGLDAGVVVNSANAAKALSELANNLPNSGGIVSWFTGDNDIASFGESLVSFGDSFAAYYNSVSGVDVSKLSGVIIEFRNLVDLANGIKNVDTGGMSSFAQNLTTLGNSGIDGFINAFTNANSRVTTAVNAMINAVITAANNQKSNLNSTFTMIVEGILTSLKSKNTEFTTVGTTIMTNFISGIRTNDNSARLAFTNIVSGCLTAMKNKFYEFITVGQTMMTKFIAGVKEKNEAAKTAFTNIVSGCLTAIRDKYTDFYNAGIYLVQGFAKGIDEYTWYAEARARAMARAAAAAAEAELDINSPSKVGYRIGGFFGLGFVNAIADYTENSYEAGTAIAASAKEGLRNAVSKIGEYIEDGIDAQPTIRPVLDLSQVQAGASKLTALLSRDQALSISAGMNRETGAAVQNGESTPASGNTYTFTQNNYSPKALSRIEIYRQTKNQFSAMKGLVET